MNSNKILKVAILTTSFPRFRGDFAGTFVERYARDLARSGCHVTVLAPHDAQADSSASPHGYEVKRFRYFFPGSLQSLAYGAGILSRIRQNRLRLLQMPFFLTSFFFSALRQTKNSDLLHAFWTPSGLIALMVGMFRKVPVAVTLWGSDIFFVRTPGLRPFFKLLIKKADAVICESGPFRDELVHLGISPDRISVIPNGIDLETFKPADKFSARRLLGLPEEKTLIMNIGGLSPVKNQKTLIEAAPQAIRAHRNLLFILVGEGETRKELETLVRNRGLQEYFLFAGLQEAGKIPHWLNSADIFVLTSVSEGNPNVILEAQSCGLAVIATRVGGVPSMIQDGENGFLIPSQSPEALAEKLSTLVADNRLREKLGQNALRSVRSNYGSWERQACELKALYARLLHK